MSSELRFEDFRPGLCLRCEPPSLPGTDKDPYANTPLKVEDTSEEFPSSNCYCGIAGAVTPHKTCKTPAGGAGGCKVEHGVAAILLRPCWLCNCICGLRISKQHLALLRIGHWLTSSGDLEVINRNLTCVAEDCDRNRPWFRTTRRGSPVTDAPEAL